ncbi:MAG: hypothetical protein B6I24_06090 [Bacteroidetes bacterium 4572_128]|nr:MAG: hypothetical protein B6I24_06090 [Bacteroidetes bacterium 4572_128]
MKISGFTMVKNADKLYYPIKESILSILPLVDEFIVALGKGDENDKTYKIIKSIKSEKIKIINTVWDVKKFPNGMENARQTDIAKSYCKGDWLFYLQADEVVNEKHLSIIKDNCLKFLNDKNVEGFLFKYLHFWGDFEHYQISHGWYKNEVRIIRNDKDIHSWGDAQSFLRIPNFDGLNYYRKNSTFKLKVKKIDAYIYHYGWVRPPSLMRKKKKSMDTMYHGEKTSQEINTENSFDYGIISHLKVFKGEHPSVMKKWIKKFHWKEQLKYSGKINKNRKKHKHERLKYKIITFLEKIVGKPLFEKKNYFLIN